MLCQLTFADFCTDRKGVSASTSARRHCPPGHDDMVQLADFIQLDADEREGKVLYLGHRQEPPDAGAGCAGTGDPTEERRDFWQLLSLVGADQRSDLDQGARRRPGRDGPIGITAGLLALANGGDAGVGFDVTAGERKPVAWRRQCRCSQSAVGLRARIMRRLSARRDECNDLAPRVFRYNDQKQAVA